MEQENTPTQTPTSTQQTLLPVESKLLASKDVKHPWEAAQPTATEQAIAKQATAKTEAAATPSPEAAKTETKQEPVIYLRKRS